MALRAGETEIVKASLTGSIIGNMLMVLGLSMLLGGWKHKELRFNRLAAETGSGMMVLAVVALVIPAIYASVTQHTQPGAHRVDQPRHLLDPDPHLRREPRLPVQDARALLRPERPRTRPSEAAEGRPWSIARSVLVLAGRGRPDRRS